MAPSSISEIDVKKQSSISSTTRIHGIVKESQSTWTTRCKKARSHSVVAIGNQERRFEVRLANNKFGCANELRTHEVKIGNEAWPTCECTCNKPKLLHLPCSHVLAACGQLGMDAISFVSPYFLKEAILNTWTGELMGFRSMGNFNSVNPAERRYIPNPEHMRTSRGRRQC